MPIPDYHILSLGGGGIRAIFSARVLEQLEQAVPGFLGKLDLLAGTSIGGIIALGLAAGMRPAQLVRLYHDEAQKSSATPGSTTCAIWATSPARSTTTQTSRSF